MQKRYLKYYIGIFLIILIDSLHVIFYDNDEMYDVYFLIDYERYLTNILGDISDYFRFSILTFWLIQLNKKIFKPLFITSLLAVGFYFLDYNQLLSLLLIPIYLILAIKYNETIFKSRKTNHKK